MKRQPSAGAGPRASSRRPVLRRGPGRRELAGASGDAMDGGRQVVIHSAEVDQLTDQPVGVGIHRLQAVLLIKQQEAVASAGAAGDDSNSDRRTPSPSADATLATRAVSAGVKSGPPSPRS